MKKSILTILALIPFALMAQRGSYVLKLSTVQIDGENKGSIKIDSIKPSQLVTYVSKYTDSLIDASFGFSISSIPFDLTNKSKKTIKINWNEAAYIDYNKKSGKIMHLGVKYIDRNNDQPSSSIIGDSKISDQATPTENVYYSSGSYGGWRENPLFPRVGKKDEKPLIGKQVKLLLPIQNGANQLDYIFTFDIGFNEYVK